MSETMSCPGCRATLRIPPGAAAIRCPACKTVITLAAPPPPQVPAAVPLPFGQPQIPTAAAPIPAAVPVPAVARSVPSRAKLIHDDDPIADEESTGRKTTARRDSLLDFEDDELNDDEVREKRRLLQLREECGPARRGALILTGSFGGHALAYLLGFVYLVVASFSGPIVLIAWAGIVLHALMIAVQLLGLGFCCAGPRSTRGIAISGLVTTVFNLLTMGISMSFSLMAVGALAQQGMARDIVGNEPSLRLLCPLTPTVEMLVFPIWITDGSWRSSVWAIVIPGLFELARIVSITVLMRTYAEDGKSPELGFRVSRFMTRIYATLFSFFFLRVVAAALIGSNTVDRNDSAMLIFLGLSYAGTVAGFAVTFLVQMYAMIDVTEIIDYKRYALKIQRLDTL